MMSTTIRPRKLRAPRPMADAQDRWLALMAYLTVATLFSSLSAPLVHCTPPIDYFIYTSQSAQASSEAGGPNQARNVSLPTISSIYATTTTSDGRGPLDGSNRSLHAPGERSQGEEEGDMDELAKRVLHLVLSWNESNDIDLETTRYAWNLMERQASLYMRNRISTLKPVAEALLREANVSSECHVAINHWLVDLGQLRKWASLMWNSWGQFPPAGLLEGSFTDLGSYRSCMRIEDNEAIGQSQYCLLDFQPLVPTRVRFHSIFKRVLDHDKNQLTAGDYSRPEGGARRAAAAAAAGGQQPASGANNRSSSSNNNNNNWLQYQLNTTKTLRAEALVELARKAQYFYYVKFRLGTCLPAKCSQEDVSRLALVSGARAVLQTTQVNCLKKEQQAMNNYQLVAIWILASLAVVAILGTLCDLMGHKEDSNSSSPLDWLLPFSIWTNSKRLFDFETAGTHGNLECIHGLRFFSMIWVIYGHTILYMEYQSFTHFYDVIETQVSSFLLLPSLNANFSVDTFFVISGILTTYVTWEYTKGDARKFNKFAFTISRYIRLTPQLAIAILCFFLLPLFGNGPMYRQVADDKAEVCYKNWHINLLYLQSYFNNGKLCIDPSWWLSIEMTFHLVSMLVIIVMIQNPAKGMMVNFVVASVLTFWGAIIHYTNGFAIQYLPSIPQRYEVSAEQTKMFFHRPYPHAASYFIGIALGYVLANRTVKKLSRTQVLQGWMVCALGLVISLWGSYYWNLGAPYTQLQATLYYNLCQILWPTSVAWIILACSLGHGGLVGDILSARCFVPLGRITYMTYLSHALIIYYHSAKMNIPVEPSMLLFTYLFIANTVLSLALGVLLTVVYESPILNLQKLLFAYLTRKFDPTLRDSRRCQPRRLAPSLGGGVGGGVDELSTANGHLLGLGRDSALQDTDKLLMINGSGANSNRHNITTQTKNNNNNSFGAADKLSMGGPDNANCLAVGHAGSTEGQPRNGLGK